MTIDDAIAALAKHANDPAFRLAIKQKLIKSGFWADMSLPMPVMKQDGPPPLFPTAEAITAVQTAIFDNWPKGSPVKGHPNRYGAAIEIWTKPKERIKITKKGDYQHKSQMFLMNWKQLQFHLKTVRKPRRTKSLDPDYLVALEAMVDGLREDNVLVGLIVTHIRDDHQPWERGIWYHDFQFLLVNLDEKGAIVPHGAKLVLSRGSVVELAPFDVRDAAGRQHGRGVILQSRHDLCGLSEGAWATNEPVEQREAA